MLRTILKVAGIILLLLLLGVAGLLIYLKKGLPHVGDAPQITIKATPDMLQRGEYLANHVTVCIDCHSKRDWTKFSGPITPGTLGEGGDRFDHSMGFPGTFYARNITPFNLTTWTDGDLYRVITTGVTRDNQALFPVMPYQYYGEMDPSDVKAVIAYIRTLAPISNTPPAREIDFPVSFLINTMPKKAHPMTRPSRSDTLAYGRYLTTIAGCRECHTKQEKGKITGEPFAGGWEFHMPDGSIVRSANLTPDKATGLGTWSAETFVGLFKSRQELGLHGSPLAAGDMQTIMPWTMYGGMDSSDLHAIYTYLHSLQPVSNKVELFTPAMAAGTK
jgi:hypothetical protein